MCNTPDGSQFNISAKAKLLLGTSKQKYTEAYM